MVEQFSIQFSGSLVVAVVRRIRFPEFPEEPKIGKKRPCTYPAHPRQDYSKSEVVLERCQQPLHKTIDR